MPPRYLAAVAFFGVKVGSLKSLLENVQAIAYDRTLGRFRAYALDHIHSTLISLEGTLDRENDLIFSYRYLELAGILRQIDYAQALELLAAHLIPPISVRLGGQMPDGRAIFLSSGQQPYERMFSARDRALVLIGWPVSTIETGVSHRPLDKLRRSMNDAYILHRYHNSWIDVDNDLHLVVGHYTGNSQQQIAEAVHAVRSYLSTNPIDIEIGCSQVAVVAADSPTLTPVRFMGRLPIDSRDIQRLYR